MSTHVRTELGPRCSIEGGDLRSDLRVCSGSRKRKVRRREMWLAEKYLVQSVHVARRPWKSSNTARNLPLARCSPSSVGQKSEWRVMKQRNRIPAPASTDYLAQSMRSTAALSQGTVRTTPKDAVIASKLAYNLGCAMCNSAVPDRAGTDEAMPPLRFDDSVAPRAACARYHWAGLLPLERRCPTNTVSR